MNLIDVELFAYTDLISLLLQSSSIVYISSISVLISDILNLPVVESRNSQLTLNEYRPSLSDVLNPSDLSFLITLS